MQIIGNFHYRCKKLVYYFPTITLPFDLIYINHRSEGKMDITSTNGMYQMLKKKDPILSPYTLWKIQLPDIESRKYLLQSFFDEEIDLLLIGNGQVIRNGKYTKEVCNNDELSKYYQPFRNTEELKQL